MTAKEILFKHEIFYSGGEMRRSIAHGAVKINGELVTDVNQEFIVNDKITIEKGKKVFNCSNNETNRIHAL